MNPFEHRLCSDHLTPSEGSHSRLDLHMFLPVYKPPPFPCTIFSNPLQGEHHEFDHTQTQEVDEHFLSIGSTWQQSSRPSSSPLPMISKDEKDRKKKNTVTSGGSVPSSMKSTGSSGQWLSSKVKMVRKVANPDRITGSCNPGEAMLQLVRNPQQSTTDGDHSSIKNGQLSCSGGVIRICSDCNTTKTPLWRSGPSGPKSLCNACGIRRRKAKRAMAAAAAAGLVPAAVGPSKLRKEKMSEGGSTVATFKKRCKFTSAQTSKQLHFDDFALDLSKNPGLQRVFPQDEKEAAMLLMALSCGTLIRG